MSIPKSRTENVDLVRVFLHEIGRVPLLTHAQEVFYGKQVQEMISLLEAKPALTKKLHREPTSQEWALQVDKSEAEISTTVRQGQWAKQKMVEANLRLVVAIAKKYLKSNLEFLDLVQEGNIGLQRGVEKFDPTKGYRFSTYAYWWIRQAITRAIAQQARTIRLPIHVIEKVNKIKRTQRQLSQQLGRTASIPEIAGSVELTPEQVRDCLGWQRPMLSLNLRVGNDLDTELGELLEDPDAAPEELIVQSDRSAKLKHLMADLSPKQQEVLALRFGLVDGQELSLAKTGEQLNLSRETVRQLEQLALKQLRLHRDQARFACHP